MPGKIIKKIGMILLFVILICTSGGCTKKMPIEKYNIKSIEDILQYLTDCGFEYSINTTGFKLEKIKVAVDIVLNDSYWEGNTIKKCILYEYYDEDILIEHCEYVDSLGYNITVRNGNLYTAYHLEGNETLEEAHNSLYYSIMEAFMKGNVMPSK